MPAHNLNMVIRTIGRLPANSKLANLQESLEERFGLSRRGGTERVSASFLSRLSAKIAAARGDYAVLSDSEHRQVVHLLWGGIPPWQPSMRDVQRWLDGLSQGTVGARRQVSRICRALVRRGEAGPATDLVRAWINAEGRRDLLRSPLLELDREWDLFGSGFSSKPSHSLAQGSTAFLDAVRKHPVLLATLHGSALLAGILDAYARAGRTWGEDAPGVWAAWRQTYGERGVSSPDPERTQAVVAGFVPSIVDWAEGRGHRVEPALKAVIHLVGDPRLEPARWHAIPEKTRRTVETWLMRQDFDALFKVIDTLAVVADQDSWPYRKEFWTRYLTDGSTQRLWLLLGPRARPIADKLGVRYGKLTSFDPYHCGLLMEIAPGIVVLEMNNNGATRVWRRGNPQAPAFYEPSYNFRPLPESQDLWMPHNPPPNGWIQRFATDIAAIRRHGT